jgi:transposase, IS5 family
MGPPAVRAQLYLSWATASDSKIVRAYEEKFNGIGRILDENPSILDLFDRDIAKLSTGNEEGRDAEYTSENLLRALIVHQVEGSSLRKTMVTLAHSLFLQEFLKLGTRSVPDYSLLDRALKSVEPKTWEEINRVLTGIAVSEGRADPGTIRVDTTVVEANIHWPTDSSLLWDSWRTLYRLLEEGRKLLPGELENRFHIRKAKKIHLFITRYSASPAKKRQRTVAKCKRKLIVQVERIADAAWDFTKMTKGRAGLLQAIGLEIGSFLPKIRKVIGVAKRAWLGGEVVRAADRIFSIFEDHVELIKRGRRHKPVEFGHMILVGQTREKWITQYDVMEEKIPDCRLPASILQRHEETFGAMPKTLVADKGFWGGEEEMAKIRKKVKVLAIPQRLRDYADEAFVALQHFRAGIEGTISVLKRAFGLLRCRYRGFRSFSSHVGLGVFCHNLVLLSGLPAK